MGTEVINYEYWQRIIKKAIIGMSVCQFCVEIVVNTILFATGQQGYNENTIAEKLIRYQLLTTLYNLVVTGICFLLCNKVKSDEKKKYILTISMSLICLNISFSHYQFAPTFLTYSLPLIFTIMYEDKRMCWNITGVNIAMLMIAVIARGMDSEYNVNIVPETIITAAILIIQAFFSTFVIDILYTRRNELNDALIQAEKAKYVDELNMKNRELEQLSQETFESIAKAVDANDPYTAGHSKRVARYAQEIAFRLGFSEQEADEVYYAGLIHDVGKLGIDNNIINKKGKLTDEEYAEIKRHPSVGYEILKDISIKGKFAEGAKCHHERIDGNGYPNHLSSDEIPYLAKIISVADAYDAMTSKRPYRDVLPQEVVRDQIERGKGTQFDPEIAEIMLDMIDEDTDYQMKQHDDE